MKTFSKNARGGKRIPPYSSRSIAAAILISASLCVFAVYALASSSSSPSSLLLLSHSFIAADHRTVLKDIQPSLDESEIGFDDSEQDSSQNQKQRMEEENGNNESPEQERMEEDRKNENQPRSQQEDNETLTLTEERSEIKEIDWKLCDVTSGPDYIPCLDNKKAIEKLKSSKHYEHRERHCPEESPACLVPLPGGYKRPIEWPLSRDKIWYSNVPRTKLAEVKGHQNWVRVDGEYLIFPGGGTQFIHGALHYIDFIQQKCYGYGFAAALKDLKVWVMNVVNVDSPDTLPVIYERGLLGMYHDWCESFGSYPRTYDLLHADHLFSKLKQRCSIVPVVAEIDRIVRPGGMLIVRDESAGITREVEILLKSLHWKIVVSFTKDKEGIITAEKSNWRPEKYSTSS